MSGDCAGCDFRTSADARCGFTVVYQLKLCAAARGFLGVAYVIVVVVLTVDGLALASLSDLLTWPVYCWVLSYVTVCVTPFVQVGTGTAEVEA